MVPGLPAGGHAQQCQPHRRNSLLTGRTEGQSWVPLRAVGMKGKEYIPSRHIPEVKSRKTGS